MMKSLFYIILSSVVMCLKAQDAHFSSDPTRLIYNYPTQTGLINGCYRVDMNYRNQWFSIGAPYGTYLLSIDEPIKLKSNPRLKFAVGAYIMQENSLGGIYKQTDFKLTLANHYFLDPDHKHLLSTGIQFGTIQASFNISEIGFENQFNNVSSFDLSRNNFESLESNRIGVIDYCLGLAHRFNSEQLQIESGIAVQHLNKPSFSFNQDSSSNLSRRYNGFIKLNIPTVKKIDIEPLINFSNQNRNILLLAGLNVTLKEFLKSGDNQQFSLGGFYRLGDAVILNASLMLKNQIIRFSYDSNISTFSKATYSLGALEVSYTLLIKCKPNLPKDFVLPCIRL